MNLPEPKRELQVGTPESAEALLTDLYVRLRKDLSKWAAVTHQTPQARMGYVGQHLVSVVTGYPGGRTGARGDDLKLPGGKTGEIKCCYRVDQLGKCKACGAAVASIEQACASCESREIDRKDDSKWLLSPKTESDLRKIFDPASYYFVLFEFCDLETAGDIDVQIFSVDPRSLGFSLCMIDYYFNIRSKSKSKAPFNLWPHSPKFLMMKPKVIYRAIIRNDDSIATVQFPPHDELEPHPFDTLDSYSRATTITREAIEAIGSRLGVEFKKSDSKNTMLARLQEQRSAGRWPDDELADDFARAVYLDRVSRYRGWLDKFAPSL